jgi:flagellin-like hook-associated protein FlgL
VDNSRQPTVRIPDPGRSGRIASSEAVVDSNGAIVGLRVLDGGSYFFGSNTGTETIPSAYHKALIDLDNGETLEADIIWEEDNATGSFFVSGFNLDFSEFILDENDQPIDNPNFSADNSGSVTTAEIGDTFSFATGSRTFLDHRDENGDLLNVSYLGGDESSKAMVGTDTDLNFLLDASNDGTKSLGEIVKSLIDLRDGLLNSSSSNFSQEVQSAELELIASEDEIVNKMGELSASLVRIETVNSHDEEYSLTIDKQISNDLEVDLSEAIMRLSRISMAYQAAMQVGSQMLNNSLLNYL